MGKINRRNFIKKTSLSGAALASSSFFSSKAKSEEYQKSPFSDLDTLSTNDWWNRPENPIIDIKVERDNVIAFGIYTLSKNVLKLTAQLFPLYPDESRNIKFQIYESGKWNEIQKKEINEIGWSTTFKIENWDDTKNVRYRLRHGKNAEFEGKIRKNPIEKDIIKLAAFSCNSNKDRGDRHEYVKNINHIDPDILFFAGDQSYDHKEHTAAWLKFGMQFRDIFRERPCITIPDDHDIGQGNLWGENGKIASSPAGNDGGYFYHNEYVKMVERAQTSHLPDPFDNTPIEQGIGVYYTDLVYGNIDFAIIEDRKFKSGPKNKIPQQGPRPDHIRNPEYDPKSIDLAVDRKKFGEILNSLNIPAPNWGTAYSIDEALEIASKIKYPVLVRPSYVLGGRGMEIVYDDDDLKTYVAKAALVSGDHPILIDDFWVILRLDKKIDTVFDDQMKLLMVTELFEDWIQNEIQDMVKKLQNWHN